jgi:hypothetical protein
MTWHEDKKILSQGADVDLLLPLWKPVCVWHITYQVGRNLAVAFDLRSILPRELE